MFVKVLIDGFLVNVVVKLVVVLMTVTDDPIKADSCTVWTAEVEVAFEVDKSSCSASDSGIEWC